MPSPLNTTTLCRGWLAAKGEDAGLYSAAENGMGQYLCKRFETP
jgi:hypothetical protein